MASKNSGPNKNADTQAAYSVAEFCEAHRISRSLFYTLIKEGQGPVTMKVRGRTLISKESGADWRQRMENGPPPTSTDHANQGENPSAARSRDGS